ncbi:MAG: hypothetical protein M1838_002592 [Thelocarpon superellum]|nr:MAG: hypothetical protein M1838_002592 [Thelocarpon superellum]
MLIQSLRVSRCTITRATASRIISPRRTIIVPSAARRADLVQDMYLSELKKYKPTPVKASDAEGHVQKYATPQTPPSPEESNLAKDLKAYEEQVVEVEGQSSAGEPVVKEEDWFEEELEEEHSAAH